MKDFKRLLRYAQEIPATRFTVWQQGAIHGAALANGPDYAWDWLEKMLDEYDAEMYGGKTEKRA